MKSICCSIQPDHWARTLDIQSYADSIKSYDNFPNALSSDSMKYLYFAFYLKLA